MSKAEEEEYVCTLSRLKTSPGLPTNRFLILSFINVIMAGIRDMAAWKERESFLILARKQELRICLFLPTPCIGLGLKKKVKMSLLINQNIFST